MNALCYKIVFSKRLGTLVAVGEHTAGQGKAAGTGVRTVVYPSSSVASADNFVGLLKSVFASVALSFVTVGYATAAGPAVNTLPTGYSVNSGNVAISTTSSATNAAMTIQQTTDKASVNWNSFSIGSGAAVNVQQNNANSVLLNRVVGNDPSQIFGKLTANGQVILINPNGVVFGKGGSVTASAFTASTFGMTDADFNNGKHKFTRNGSTAGVTVEEGATIDTTGYVALMGASVDNQGTITTQGGAVVLAAGESVTLPSALTDNISVPLRGKVRLELLPSTLNAMVANSGTITTEGGQVLMQAAALSDAVASITHTGTIDTTGTQGGQVHLLADGGHIRVSGSIKANSTNGTAGGDIYIGRDKDTNVLAAVGDVRGATLESQGGFIETSGSYLATNGVKITAKDWLLDPTNIQIVAASTGFPATEQSPASGTPLETIFQDNTSPPQTSEVLVSTIQNAINTGTNVTITTTNTGTQGSGVGNITVVNALNLVNNSTTNSPATLKLIADNGIFVDANITGSSGAGRSGLVNIDLLAKGNPQGSLTTANATQSSGIVVNDNIAISTNGTVKMDGTNNSTAGNSHGIRFKTGSSLTAASFDIQGKAVSLQTGSHGVLINGGSLSGTSFTATSSTVASVINGTSKANISGVTAGTNMNGTNINFNAGVGGLTVKGSNENTQLGLRVSAAGDLTTVVTNGNVTLGALDANSNFSTRGSITANSGSLTILGSAVSNDTGGNSITANNGVSINIEGRTTAGSTSNAVSFSNIAIRALGVAAAPGVAAIPAGNINITGTSGTGAAINLASNVTLEGRNVTLKGTAANGTLAVNGGGGVNGSGKITASGEVVIDGVSANIWGYSTVTNGPISAAGDITIKGTGTAKHGVWLGNNVASSNITSTAGGITIEGNTAGAGGIGGSAIGVGITGNAVITANNNVNITGKTHGNPAINSLGNITSTTGNVTIDGYSRDSRGVVYSNTITANIGEIKVIGGSGVDGSVTSTAASAGNEHGVYFSGLAKANKVTIQGTSINNVGTFVGSTSGTNIDATDKVTITGTSTASTGVNLGSTNLNAAFNATIKSGGDTSVTGTGVRGVHVWAGSNINAKNIDVVGTAVTRTAGDSGIGVDFERIGASTANFNSSEDIRIEGTVTGAGVGSGVKTSWRNQTGSSPVMNADGNFTLRANNRSLPTNTNIALNADSGLQVTAGKNIVVQAETNNADVRAMQFYSLGDMYRGNTSFVSKNNAGDVLIQANQGAIAFNNIQTSSIGKSTDINGRNITIDNTGAGMATGAIVGAGVTGSGGTKANIVGTGSINTTTGVVVAGAGKANGEGINFADNRNITATGQLNIMGASKTFEGIKNITTLKGGTVNIKGISDGNSAGINTSGFIESTAGDINLEGTSALSAGVSMNSNATTTPAIKASKNVFITGFANNAANDSRHGVVLLGATTVEGENVTITGTSVRGNGVINTAAIKATAGDVTITGTSTGTTLAASALSLQGEITASNNVAIVGNNTNAANASMIAYINKAITATNGKVDVTTTTAGTATSGLRLDTGANLTGKTEVIIKTDSLNMATTATLPAIPAIIHAGTGKVTITTDSADARINIGNGTGTGATASGVDLGSTTTSSRTLGLTSAELNRITAGNLVIGDASNTGGITVSAATTTNTATGNVTLQTGGNIAVNAALTVGGAGATKNLTLNGAGNVSTSSAISQTAAIKAAGLELLGTNATHTLTDIGNDIKKLAGNTGTVSLTNNVAFGIDTVNTRVGLTTTGNTTLNSTAAVTQASGANIKAAGLALVDSTLSTKTGTFTLNNDNNEVGTLAANAKTVSYTNKTALAVGDVGLISGVTATGDVSITTKAGDLTLKKNITAANVNLNAAGAVLRDAAVASDGIIKASLLRIKAGAGVGTSASRIKTDVATLSMESAGDQYVTEANAVTVSAKSSEGSVNIDVTIDDLTVGSSTLIGGAIIDGIGAYTGVVLTAQAGNLNINQAISNTSSGDVVLGAGVSKNAGDGSGGDVKTTSTMDVTNTNGNTYVYTGSAAGAGLLSDIDTSFSELRLSGDMGTPTTPLAQNADSYVKYVAGKKIEDGAKAQVMFREKITLDTSSISGVALDKTYGDANTTSSAGDQAALFAQMQAKLKQANFGEIITRPVGTTSDVNVIKISKAALINDLSGSLNGAIYSTSDHLTAKTHVYGALTSGKYTANLISGEVKVNVKQKEVSYTGVNVTEKTYDGKYQANLSGTATLNKVAPGSSQADDQKVIDGDKVQFSGTAQGTYESKNVVGINGRNNVTLSGVSLVGDDVNNYSLKPAVINAQGTITPKSLNLTDTTVADKTYDRTTSAKVINTGTLNGFVTGETLDVTVTGKFNDPGEGNQKIVEITGTLLDRGGNLATNYRLANAQAIANITAALKPPSPVVPTDSTPRVKIPVGSANPFALASAEDLADETCSANSIENCYCEPSELNKQVDICYEPKAGAKSAAR